MAISLNDIQVGVFIVQDVGQYAVIRHILEIRPVETIRRGRGDHKCIYDGYELPAGQRYKWREWCAIRRMATWADRMATPEEISQLTLKSGPD